VLPEKVQFTTVEWDLSLLRIPPPLSAVLPEKVQFNTVGLELWFCIPPPLIAVLPEKVQFSTLGLLVPKGLFSPLYIPPPV
jgi:hypothetical protein